MTRRLRTVALGPVILLSALVPGPDALTAEQVEPLELARNRAGSLDLILTEAALHVQGVTAGGEVAYLGASLHEVRESWASLRSHSGILVDDDLDGEVAFEPESGVSHASIWLVLDLASGETVGITPDGFTKHSQEDFLLDVSSTGRSVSTARQDVEFLLHRPGVGVWFGKGLDGGQGDDSLHADGVVHVDVGRFRSLRTGGVAAPPSLRPGDRVLAIDVDRLESVTLDLR